MSIFPNGLPLPLILAVTAVIAYFCGCFNGAVIVSKYILRNDVRNHGSGNAGLTNFFRTFGGPLTFVVILCDVLKAVVALLVSQWLMFSGYTIFISADFTVAYWDTFAKYWAGLFCLLGHMFPCMFQFKGGKGILSGGVVAIMIDWRIAVVVWGGFLILTDPVRFPWLSVGRGQLSLYQLVLLPADAHYRIGFLPGRPDRLETPGQYPALAGGK